MDYDIHATSNNTITTTAASSNLTSFTSSKRRRNTLTKNPPPSAYPSKSSLRKQQSSAALQRAPSAPSPYQRTQGASLSTRELHHRSQSNTFGSSTSSLEHLSSAPSPINPSTDFFASSVNPYQLPHHLPLTPQTSDDRHNDLIGAPFDASGLLSSFQASGMNEKQTAGGQSPAPLPLTHTHTSPDLRSHPLRTSQTFGPGAVAMMEVTPPKSENGTLSPKRFSGDGHGKPAGPFRKKSGFSSFVNNMLGSPRTIKISAPENPMHMIHVGYDNQTGQFTVSPLHISTFSPAQSLTYLKLQGLPADWQRILSDSGITKTEQDQNPQMMMNIVETYKNNLGGSEDTVWQKFDHAKLAESPQSSTSSYRSPTTPQVGSSNPGQFSPMTGVISPPASPRFPQNHEGSFENPRAPPPIPTGPPASSMTSLRAGQSPTTMMPNRPAPKPPAPNLRDLAPTRPAPPPPMNRDLPLRPPQEPSRPPPAPGSLPMPASAPPAIPLQVSQPNTPQIPNEEARSRSNSKGPSTTPPRSQQVIQSPAQYQQQQEQAMLVAQQAIQSKQLDRSRSQRQVAPGAPEVPPKILPQQYSPNVPQTQFAAVTASPALESAPQVAAVPRPRQKRQQSNIVDVTARLRAICTPGDPTTKYNNLSKIGQGASGGVFTAFEAGSKRCVAIKQMNLEQQPKKDLIINEIVVMKGSQVSCLTLILSRLVLIDFYSTRTSSTLSTVICTTAIYGS